MHQSDQNTDRQSACYPPLPSTACTLTNDRLMYPREYSNNFNN